MDNLPSGTVTFLFTDIEGSTRRWEEAPAAMAIALERQADILSRAIQDQAGHVFKTIGDAFCAVFADPANALAAALAAQRALGAEDWSRCGRGLRPLRLRMGLHTGRAEDLGGDYFGPTLNRTARLMAAGHGGQILLSLATEQIVRDALPATVTLRDWGEHRLQDLRFSEHIFQVLAPGLADVPDPPRTTRQLQAHQRILVDPEASGLGDLMANMVAALRDEATVAALTPEQAQAVANRRPRDLTEYRLGRIAKWSQPRHYLDRRFVALTVLMDQGEEDARGRWRSQPTTYAGLGAVLAAVHGPALVLLGPPGSGKSTLLRQFELETAVAALRGEDPSGTATFFIQLNQYRPEGPTAALPAPEAWLRERWAERYPDLPPLERLLAEGRMVLLLDGLNEIPVAGAAGLPEAVHRWKDWLLRLATICPGNRVVFSCRTLDYSAPLSSPALRVPQARIEPLSDEQVELFLRLYNPVAGEVVWRSLVGSPELEALRVPYFLSLLVDQLQADASMAHDRAALITGFARQALWREVERDNPCFGPCGLLSHRDLRRLTQWQWHNPYELPEDGPLLPALADLAYGMQEQSPGAGQSQLRLRYDAAVALLGSPSAPEALRAGVALAVLDEDQASDEVLFRHQLLQEYFAARRLVREPRPALVRAIWRVAAVVPPLEAVLATLPPAEALPPLATTGWEETTLLAATMSADASTFVRGLVPVNPVLAGRCALLPALRTRLDTALRDDIRSALLARSRDPAADLRARMAAGLTLGLLGDPRFHDCQGADGIALVPPMVSLAAGTYPIGDDAALAVYGHTWHAHCPRHLVTLPAFALGAFAVTNAEFDRFIAAGGYDDPRWWPTAAAQTWRSGADTAAGVRANRRWWRREFQRHPERLRDYAEGGVLPPDIVARWREWLALPDGEFEIALANCSPSGRFIAPYWWHDRGFSNPGQPVCGVTWFEARAYCAWLAAQTGQAFRLPTEVEWEAAARGPEGRRFAFGDIFQPDMANTAECHVRRTSPVGIFVAGDTPDGLSDMAGNVQEWTASAWGRDVLVPHFAYPYNPLDGREDPDSPVELMRVARGGAWNAHQEQALAFLRDPYYPDDRGHYCGFRVALSA